MKKLLIIPMLMVAFAFVSFAGINDVWAGASAAQMSVTINVSNACEITTDPNIIGSYDAILGGEGHKPSVYGMSIKCTSGLPWTSSVVLAADDIAMVNGNGKKLRLTLHKDAAAADGDQITVASPTIATGTGTGEVQTVNVYSRLRPNTTDCTLHNSTYMCESGDYTATLNFEVAY